MNRPDSPWEQRIDLAVHGFNPVPWRSHNGLTILCRRHHGTHATPYATDLTHATGPEYTLHPACEDLRPVGGTNPRLMIGALYSQTTKQAALWTQETNGRITCLHRPQTIFLQTHRPRISGRPEKNWLLWSHTSGQIRGIYNVCPFALVQPAADPNTWSITHKHNWTAPAWTRPLTKALRGSTPPVTLPTGRLLVLWHLRDAEGGYWTGASIHGPDWPHNPEAATARPLLTPDDATCVSPLWPPNTCIFPMWAELHTSGRFDLWAGDSDKTSIILSAPIEAILRTMEPVR